jgi:hypothetical protein
VCLFRVREDRGNCQEGRRILKRAFYIEEEEEEQKANIFSYE